MNIERLGANEIARLRELNLVFARAFDDRESYEGAPPSDAYLNAWLARNDVYAIVALDADRVVGGLVAYVLEKFERERSEVYLYDLAVEEAHRRKGIGTALIEDLRARCAAHSYVVFVQADHGDEPAIALYSKLGTREDVLHFDIAVPSKHPSTE